MFKAVFRPAKPKLCLLAITRAKITTFTLPKGAAVLQSQAMSYEVYLRAMIDDILCWPGYFVDDPG